MPLLTIIHLILSLVDGGIINSDNVEEQDFYVDFYVNFNLCCNRFDCSG